MTNISIEDIRRFIYQEFKSKFNELHIPFDHVIGDFDLFEEQVLDSFGIIELISALQDQYHVEIDLEEMETDQFTRIEPLSTYILEQLKNTNIDSNTVFKNDLSQLNSRILKIHQTEFLVWIADTTEKINKGLMHITPDDLLPDGKKVRGMLFDHKESMALSYWMKNTSLALDIAYIRTDQIIVNTYTMDPDTTERKYPSLEPVRYALEVPKGTFASTSIVTGMKVDFL